MLWLDMLLAYLHFIAIIATVSTVAIEAVLCRRGLDGTWVARLGRIDLLYLIMAALALTTGLLRLFLGIKGWQFYVYNPVFWVKIGLFVVVGLISIIPTMRFIRWGRTLRTEGGVVAATEINATLPIIYLELLLLAAIPLAATLMARGFGY